MPFFALPWAFLAFMAVPALAAIYWLRNRFRRYPVSSLILWVNQRRAREGGARVQRIQTPLLFFLELLAIVFLVIAASRPLLHGARSARSLIVVLDDSFSMLAAGPEAPKKLAAAALKKELRGNRYYSVRFVLAGREPQVLGEPARTTREALASLSDWTCHSPSDCLNEAVTFAAELGGKRARILVVTDHAPPDALGEKKVKWWAFGSPQPNVAFVSAARTSLDGQERCLIEIANLSSHSTRTTLTLQSAGSSRHPEKTALKLEAGEVHRVLLELDENASAVRARIGDDALGIDNEVVLLPHVERPVRVQVRVADPTLRSIVENGISATKQALLVAARPELVITDRAADRAPAPETWVLHLVAEEEAAAYTGPFVVDRSHPLTEGLSLEGVIWGGGKTAELAGILVVSAGNTPLLTDAEDAVGRHDLRMQIRPDLSTLQDTPNWPILIWNLVEWRSSRTPGLKRTNLRLGMEARLRTESDTESVRVATPGGETRDVTVHGQGVMVKAEETGVYEIRSGDEKYTFASNALNQEESDLTACASARLGNWKDAGTLRREYRSIAWVFLLLALAALTGHTVVAAGRG